MSMRNSEKPQVGVSVIIFKGNEVLMGKRKGAHGPGTWNFPGGKLDYFETIRKCAVRETKEETGLDVKLIENEPITFTEDFFETGEHYVTFYMMARYTSGTPTVVESEKCEEWEWFNRNKLPKPLFLPVQNLIKQKYNLLQR